MTETNSKGVYGGMSVLQIGLGALMVSEAGYMAGDRLAVIGAVVGATGLTAVALLAYKDYRDPTVIASKQD